MEAPLGIPVTRGLIRSYPAGLREDSDGMDPWRNFSKGAFVGERSNHDSLRQPNSMVEPWRSLHLGIQAPENIWLMKVETAKI